MNDFGLRSPFVRTAGVVYFARMLDKIRLHAQGKLGSAYVPNLGRGFDERCVRFLRIDYNTLVERVKHGGTNEEVLQWCFATGRRPETDEIHLWNEYMRKCGWNDELTETLKRRKKESGMAGRSEIQTMFEYIDADEGRTPFVANKPELPVG